MIFDDQKSNTACIFLPLDLNLVTFPTQEGTAVTYSTAAVNVSERKKKKNSKKKKKKTASPPLLPLCSVLFCLGLEKKPQRERDRA